MKLGLFGGTYNPVHYAHLIVAEWIRDSLNLDAVYLMPTAIPPHRKFDNSIIDIHHRIEMVRLAVSDNPRLKLADYESNPELTAYSVDTVRDFINRNPDVEGGLFFIIGEDNYRSLHTWKEPGELSRLSRIVVARRSGKKENIVSEGIDQPLFLDTPLIDISASLVRDRIKQGRSVKYLVPDAVAKYIFDNGLFTS